MARRCQSRASLALAPSRPTRTARADEQARGAKVDLREFSSSMSAVTRSHDVPLAVPSLSFSRKDASFSLPGKRQSSTERLLSRDVKQRFRAQVGTPIPLLRMTTMAVTREDGLLRCASAATPSPSPAARTSGDPYLHPALSGTPKSCAAQDGPPSSSYTAHPPPL